MSKFILCVLCAMAFNLYAASDIRCCVDEIARNPDGTIKRSSKVIRDFKSIYPCPATGLKTGPCPGWSINHWVPLKCFGRDVVENLFWLPNALKSCAGKVCIDRWEMQYHCKREIITLS